eukprot:gene11799-24720_t
MRLDPMLAEAIAALDPIYAPFIEPNGTVVVRLHRALYGCIESSKLWFEHISKSLARLGYTFNQKDRCVLNKTVNNLRDQGDITFDQERDVFIVTIRGTKFVFHRRGNLYLYDMRDQYVGQRET